jgi:hypothetical protein
MSLLVIFSIIYMATCPGSSQAGPFTGKSREARCRNQGVTPLLSYRERCSARAGEAQETFLSALDSAIRAHGAGDQAHRIAYMVLKQKFEKRGDHWMAKDDPADRGGGRQADQQIQQSAS